MKNKPEWLTHDYVISQISKGVLEEFKGIKIILIGGHDEINKVEDIIFENYHQEKSLTCFATRSPGRTFRGSCKMQSENLESLNNQSNGQ